MGYGGIDFAPQPAPGSNPFEPVVQGINLGFGIQQQVREQQKFQADQLAAKAQSDMEKEKLQLMKFGELASLYDKTKNPVLKRLYYQDTLRPAAKQALGADLPEQPDGDFDEHLGAAAEASDQLAKGVLKFDQYKERLGSIYFDAMRKGNTEAAAAIATGTKFGEREGTTPTSQTPEFKQTQLRKEFATRVKDINYLSRRDGYNEAQNAIKNPSVANDIGLIYAVARMRDPGGRLADKDVQEAAKTGALPQELQMAWNSVVNKNERLSDFSRKSLVDSVNQLYAGYTRNYNELKSNYRDKALEAGVNPDNVTNIFESAEAGPGGGSSTASPTSEIESMSDEELKRIIEGK